MSLPNEKRVNSKHFPNGNRILQASNNSDSTMANFNDRIEELKNLFIRKYGKNTEVTLPTPICIIRDNFPSPHSSGSNGYMSKLRFVDGKLEYYKDFWDYGWYSDTQTLRKFAEMALMQVC